MNIAKHNNCNNNIKFINLLIQAVMKLTRHQLEKELLEENIARLEELPSYAYLIGDS